jgi:hypothetical protein
MMITKLELTAHLYLQCNWDIIIPHTSTQRRPSRKSIGRQQVLERRVARYISHFRVLYTITMTLPVLLLLELRPHILTSCVKIIISQQHYILQFSLGLNNYTQAGAKVHQISTGL